MPVRHNVKDNSPGSINLAFRANLAAVPYVSVIEDVAILADGQFTVQHNLGKVPDWWQVRSEKPGLEVTPSLTVRATAKEITLIATAVDPGTYPHRIDLRVEKFT